MFFPLSIFHKAKYQQLNPKTLTYLTYENARVLMSNWTYLILHKLLNWVAAQLDVLVTQGSITDKSKN